MTQREMLTEIATGRISMLVYKVKTIDGNDGTSESEYFEDEDQAREEASGTISPYFYEISTVTWRPDVIAKYVPLVI